MNLTSVDVERGGATRKEPGFPIVWEPYAHIQIGVQNRGGIYKRLPLGIRYAKELVGQERVLKGSFMKTQKGTLLLIEEQPDSQPRIGVLLYAQPGFRGEGHINGIQNVLLTGQIWDSPNGTLGMGDVCLAIAKPGDHFEIHRTGRLYGASEDLIVTVGDELDLHTMSVEEESEAKDIAQVDDLRHKEVL